jgi:cytochrome c peroxidase
MCGHVLYLILLFFNINEIKHVCLFYVKCMHLPEEPETIFRKSYMNNLWRKKIVTVTVAACMAFSMSAYKASGNTSEIVELGRTLYFDPRLSADDTVSCASCHSPDHGFTDNKKVSTGVRGQTGTRNSPTVINRLYSKSQFWDGRAPSLEEQAKGPIVNPVEMGMKDHADLVAKLKGINGYAVWFKKAFGHDLNIDDLAKAIATFERTVVSDDSNYDRYISGDQGALNASERRGFEIFQGKGKCIICHGGANFTDESFHNIGVGMDKPNPDLGRYSQTKAEQDKGAFKTPTLRDIASTGPYMHDGSEKTLADVVAFYNKGGTPNPNLDMLIVGLGLSQKESEDLVAFMKSLSGKRWRSIAAPAGFPK